MLQPLRKQQTISKPVTVSGFGLWSGIDSTIEFRPAGENQGITFVRSDLQNEVRIPATVEHRVESPRRTILSVNGQSVEMVEHVMAALAGLRIDNCEIHAHTPEMPGCDGSSQHFVDALLSAGIVEQAVDRQCLVVNDVTRVGDDDSWIEARPGKPGELSVHYRLDYGSDSAIGRETFKSHIDAEVLCKELAPARTFILAHEAEWLRNQGIAQRVTTSDVLVFGDEGVIDNELRFEDECVRHKVLDLVGDFALAGCDIYGHFVAQRSGHRLNATMVSALLAEGQVIGNLRRTA